MISRAFRAAIVAALVVSSAPVAAQQFSDSFEFLQAVRESDGAKVMKFLNDKALRLVNSKDRGGDGALHIVTKRADATYLRVLLQQDDVDTNIQDAAGNTPLILAADKGWFDGVQILIKYGANVNIANKAGQTPLIKAVLAHQSDSVRQLLAAGADPDKADYQTGMSAREYAKRETRYPMIAKLIEDAPKGGGGAAMAGPKL